MQQLAKTAFLGFSNIVYHVIIIEDLIFVLLPYAQQLAETTLVFKVYFDITTSRLGGRVAYPKSNFEIL